MVAESALAVDTGTGGIGVIIRDEHRGVLLSSSKFLCRCADVEEAETRACKEGLALAADWINRPGTL
uniref:RNase H type-1 domain-containing protein n=1 Tax=Leersia perrieri TaxID=77586 RepID=A0A0D9X3H0_9ORYZ